MDNKNLKERDFHHYVGWKIPLFIKLAWLTFFIAAVTYLGKFMVPDLLIWLRK